MAKTLVEAEIAPEIAPCFVEQDGQAHRRRRAGLHPLSAAAGIFHPPRALARALDRPRPGDRAPGRPCLAARFPSGGAPARTISPSASPAARRRPRRLRAALGGVSASRKKKKKKKKKKKRGWCAVIGNEVIKFFFFYIIHGRKTPSRNHRSTRTFARRRAEAREELYAIDPAKQGGAPADPLRRDWFEAVYALAEGDAAKGALGQPPRPSAAGTMARKPAPRRLARARHRQWSRRQRRRAGAAGRRCHRLRPGSGRRGLGQKGAFPEIDFCATDLFAPPPAWAQGFDLVNEIYTLQALPPELLPRTRAAVAGLVKPGGRLLAIARARNKDQTVEGPPWPLSRADLVALEACGLRLEALDDISAPASRPCAIFARCFERFSRGRSWRTCGA